MQHSDRHNLPQELATTDANRKLFNVQELCPKPIRSNFHATGEPVAQ